MVSLYTRQVTLICKIVFLLYILAVLTDTLKTKDYNFQDICFYGINTLNVFYRKKQHNPEVQTMVLNMIMRVIKLYFIEINDKINNQK